ncbi:MAG TPA: glycosyltransferase family 39 protein [Geminicoccaceae bacterium]|nr:glycosyltransferase family 39 protein [Geminicoccus sp.]HMU50675.1 glycosyltransferase family 39 protein [Geminicoccaceae bacterium]
MIHRAASAQHTAALPRRPAGQGAAWAIGAWVLLGIVLVVALAVRLPGLERPTHVGFLSYYVDEPKILTNVIDVIRLNPLLAHWPYALYYWLAPQVLLFYAAHIPSLLPYTHDLLDGRTVRDLVALHLDSAVLLVRLNMLLLSLGTVAVTFAYGRRCAGRWGGLAAASVVALAPVAVNLSRWAYYDTPLTFWYWLAVGLLAWTWTERSLRGVYLCAALVAWTVTTKQNGAPIVLLWLVTMLVVVARHEGLPWHGPWRSRHFWLSGLLAVAVVLACYPTLLNPDSLRQLGFTAGSVYVQTDGQLAARMWSTLMTRHWPLQGPFWLLVVLATGLVPLAALSRDRCLAAMCIAAGVGYYAIVGYSTQNNDRLILPLVPALGLGLAGWIAVVHRLARPEWARAVLSVAMIVVAAIPLALSTIRFDLLLTAADTRIQAREWLLANLQPGAKIAIEAHVARMADMRDAELGLDYVRDNGIRAFQVEQFNSVAVHPLSWYREQGMDAVVRADAMLALAWRYARLGQETFLADADRKEMGKGSFFGGLPLATIIETYASQRMQAASAVSFEPSPTPSAQGNLVDLAAQFQYYWRMPLAELWRRHDEIVLGPSVVVLRVR